MSNKQNTIYSDLDINLTPHPVTQDVSLQLNTQAVKQALKNLIMFKKYEKPFNYDVNTGVYDSLFEIRSPIEFDVIRTKIISTIQRYEPRVIVKDVRILDTIDENSLVIFIDFSIINIGTSDSITIQLKRTR